MHWHGRTSGQNKESHPPGGVLQQPHGADVVLRQVVLRGGGLAPLQVQRRGVRQQRHRRRAILDQVAVEDLAVSAPAHSGTNLHAVYEAAHNQRMQWKC